MMCHTGNTDVLKEKFVVSYCFIYMPWVFFRSFLFLVLQAKLKNIRTTFILTGKVSLYYRYGLRRVSVSLVLQVSKA